MSRKLWIDSNTGGARVDRRLERINDDRMDRVYRAYRLLEAYANPLRNDLPLSKTEAVAVQVAAKVLWKASA